ncbi:ras-specific guanine nucleotide-releasing factor 2-like [Coccinella septempunctata]|uniref:ras-specific guanine nucleotide-releasing factor 2-like n=1 Tax=Coccinella septempunctata TaxID=41139 RepID=UPI001D07B4CC|nr:ras-specific guanine nucleotide-releasing factor 2-like [Coccinella septempunctata]
MVCQIFRNLLFYYDSEHCHRPSGILLLEGCYCERLITTGSASKTKDGSDRQYCFAISYRKDNIRQYELRALNEMDCKNWIEAIREASFNKLLLQMAKLEQKHLHLLQIIESEKTAKWQYTQQCDDFASEIKKLRAECLSTFTNDLELMDLVLDLMNDRMGKKGTITGFFVNLIGIQQQAVE